MTHQTFESATESATSKEESATPAIAAHRQVKSEQPPNGGIKAWVQVLGAFMLFFNSWYVVTSS